MRLGVCAGRDRASGAKREEPPEQAGQRSRRFSGGGMGIFRTGDWPRLSPAIILLRLPRLPTERA